MEALFSGAASFAFFHFATHPKSKINKRLPSKKISRIQIFPRIHIQAKNRIFHFHHWMLFAPAYVFAQKANTEFLHSDIITGFLLGGIIQGLLYADRFRFVIHQKEYHKIKKSSYNLSFLRKLI